jgi:DNA-binding HxlR family transcriptional regulator
MGSIILPDDKDRLRLADSNLKIAQAVFGKWCLEIFVILYNLGPAGFERLRKDLGGISPRVLSRKLKMMETRGLVQRTVVVGSRPPGVRYSLTHDGLILARLGTPVFLFLRFEEQLRQPVLVS